MTGARRRILCGARWRTFSTCICTSPCALCGARRLNGAAVRWARRLPIPVAGVRRRGGFREVRLLHRRLICAYCALPGVGGCRHALRMGVV